MESIMKLYTEKDLHIARKIWHVCGVAAILWIYMSFPYKQVLALGTFALSGILLFDSARLFIPSLNKAIQKVFSFCMRESEKDKLSGMSYMIAGAILISLLFEREIVILALVFLGLGDPIASIFGILFGKNKIGSKSLEGTFAAFITCSVASLIYFLANGFFDHRIWIVVPLAGIWGALSELLQIKHIDDNFSLPVLSAIGLWGLFLIFGA